MEFPETTLSSEMSTTPPKRLRLGALSGMALGASGFLRNRARGPIPNLVDARAQAALVCTFLCFLTGEAMAGYALLLSEGVVPAVSSRLADNLCLVPPALFALSKVVETPHLLGGTAVPMLLLLVLLELVCNSGTADGRHPREGEPSGAPNSSKILCVAGVRAFFLSASVLLSLAASPLSAAELARSQPAANAVMFLSFVTAEAIVIYAVLLSEGVVPAVSTGLAKKLSWVPPALFLLALAIESPLLLVGSFGPMLLLPLPPELVGN